MGETEENKDDIEVFRKSCRNCRGTNFKYEGGCRICLDCGDRRCNA